MLSKKELKVLSDDEFRKLYNLVMKEAENRVGENEKRREPKNRVPDQVILSRMKEIELKHGMMNHTIWVMEGNSPTYETVCKRFDSWKKACELAGVNLQYHSTFSDDDILAAIRRQARIHGGSLSLKQYIDSKQKPVYQVIDKRFGSFSDACEKAGVTNAFGKREKRGVESPQHCPKCKKEWIPPVGSASYCRRCETYYRDRNINKKQKEQ